MELREWIGRAETLRDTITPWPARALAATLDHPPADWPAGAPLPPLWHWLYFLSAHPASELGPDGHARRGGFLPPVDLPRRMWAGGRFTFTAPLCIGDSAERRSHIAAVQPKHGRNGPLVFVTVRHEIHTARGLALTEDHDIVYRERPRPGDTPAPQPAPADAVWQRTLTPDPVLLFRYSALTFNGHRIHYDHRYAVQEEGYPGLVVHGPLLATLLLDLVRREAPERPVTAFEFRATGPVFDGQPVTLCGAPAPGEVRLWAHVAGRLAMTARAATG